VHARDPGEIVFTRGTTEAINLVANGLARSRLARGDRVLTSVMDHHSNIVPWHLIRTYFGTTLEFLDVDDSGRLRMDELERYLDGRTKVVTLPHVSNVLGTVVPITEIAKQAHDAGSLVVLDAAQSAPHRPIDVQALGVDCLAFSGHKTLGPTGIGVLWARRELLQEMPPWMGGGQMIESVARDRITYREPPAKFEAGTPNIAGAVGLKVALDFLEGVGWERMVQHERALTQLFFEEADARLGDRMTIYGPKELDDRQAVISFSLRGAHPHDIATLLDAEGIAVRAGQHCSQILMARFGVPAMTRVSPYIYNTESEIERFFDALDRAMKVLT
jgi:cysteine desulfurase/selenocysteine lyase